MLLWVSLGYLHGAGHEAHGVEKWAAKSPTSCHDNACISTHRQHTRRLQYGHTHITSLKRFGELIFIVEGLR